MSGKEKTYQAWDGVPGNMLKTHRRYNGIGAYRNADGEIRYYDNETDNYNQEHYQLHYSRQLSRYLYLNAALHYTPGKGYYEQYKEEEKLSDYQIPDIILTSDTLTSTDLIRRKWLDNRFYGSIFSLNYNKSRVNLRLGGGWNYYVGDHFGNIIWAENPGVAEKGYRWYENRGKKKDYNLYSKLNYSLTNSLNLFGDVQVRGINYLIAGIDDDLRNLDQEHNFLFFNPKMGLNYSPSARHRTYLSFSVANREPNRSNFTDADPLQPLPVPEKLFDYEAGYQFSSENFTMIVNLYMMDYDNQLVLTGEINDVGSPVMTNVPSSYRTGIEIQSGLSFKKFNWSGNLSLSRNKISEMNSFVDNWDYWNDPETEPFQLVETLKATDIAFSPSIVAGSNIHYDISKVLNIEIQSKYIGKQYIDNTMNESRKLSPYFVNDLRIAYTFRPDWVNSIDINFLAANLFSEKYSSNAWVYRYFYENEEKVLDGYFPQAGINFYLGVALRF